MAGYSAVIKGARYTPSESSVLMLPRRIVSSRRAVLYAHGAGGDGANVVDGTGQKGITLSMAALSNAGFVVLSGDFGGAHTYGNDAGLAAMEGAWAYLQASGLCATDKVICMGGSMGFMSISRFAAAHPTWVSGMNGWIPAIDIEDVRTRDVLGLRASVNTAWALPAGSYIGGADQTPVPTSGRPLASSNLSAVTEVPTHLWYSTADTAATSSAVDSYAAGRANVVRHIVSSSLGHTDAAILAADVSVVVTLARTWA